MPKMESWIQKSLVPAMTDGGLGLKGISDTPFYKFITSNDGLSQLGIPPTEPSRLLNAYKGRAFSVDVGKSFVRLQFGNIAVLKLETPHPSSGSGKLTVSSWMEWILDKKDVTDAGFVSRSNLPAGLQQYPRLQSPLGGLMLRRGRFGSSGLWRFPASLIDYEVDWLMLNKAKIEDLMISQVTKLLQKELR